MPNHDAIIIGTGQAGPALARRLVAAGGKVAIIERKLFGGADLLQPASLPSPQPRRTVLQ